MCANTSLLTNLTRVPGVIEIVDGLTPAGVIVMTTTDDGGGAGAVYEKAPLRRPVRPSALVTVTSTPPAACGGAVTEIDVALATTTFDAAVPSNDTAAPAANPVPVKVTVVPPAVVVEAGAIAVSVGATGAGEGVGGGAEPT